MTIPNRQHPPDAPFANLAADWASTSNIDDASTTAPAVIENTNEPLDSVSQRNKGKLRACVAPRLQIHGLPWDLTVPNLLYSIPRFEIVPRQDVNFQFTSRFLKSRYKPNTDFLKDFMDIEESEDNPYNLPDDRSILFPNAGLNPNLPSKPGNPGILLTSRNQILKSQPLTVFTMQADNPGFWVYAGEYRLENAGELSMIQFKQLPAETQKSWEASWAASLFSKTGTRSAPKSRESELSYVRGLITTIRSNNYSFFSQFWNEIVPPNIMVMTCIGYDQLLLQHIKSKYEETTRSRPQSKSPGPALQNASHPEPEPESAAPFLRPLSQPDPAPSASSALSAPLRRSARDKRPLKVAKLVTSGSMSSDSDSGSDYAELFEP
ncbi:hypothetical protein D9757_009351 [Collybiopsis confluens]|uniref:DUF6697 domain-containing protein n=1 Tax=Collybiopsis confluens TaxID=2823264 RepID=A0A8H5M208_9AGAR|nr:hypothetical protein D9757_009351 [Collybiopsis confluens]